MTDARLDVIGLTTDGTVWHTTRRWDGTWTPFRNLTKDFFGFPAIDIACAARGYFLYMTEPRGFFAMACFENQNPRTVLLSYDGSITSLPWRSDPPFDQQVFPPGVRNPGLVVSLSAAAPRQYMRHAVVTRPSGEGLAAVKPDADMSSNLVPRPFAAPVAVRSCALLEIPFDEITGESYVNLLVAGADGVLRTAYGNADHWGPFNLFSVAGPQPGDIVDVSAASGGAYCAVVTVVTGDGRLLLTSLWDGYDNNAWHPWFDVEVIRGQDVGTFVSASASFAEDGSGNHQLHVVGVTTNGRLLHMLTTAPFVYVPSFIGWSNATYFGDVELGGVGKDVGYFTAVRCY